MSDLVTVTFKGRDKSWKVQGEVGTTILDLAHSNKVPLEGACEGSLACSTCHVIFPKEIYDQLPEAADEEEDMLDLAFDLTHTSRLGCQIFLTREMEGIEIKLPAATRNISV